MRFKWDYIYIRSERDTDLKLAEIHSPQIVWWDINSFAIGLRDFLKKF